LIFSLCKSGEFKKACGKAYSNFFLNILKTAEMTQRFSKMGLELDLSEFFMSILST